MTGFKVGNTFFLMPNSIYDDDDVAGLTGGRRLAMIFGFYIAWLLDCFATKQILQD